MQPLQQALYFPTWLPEYLFELDSPYRLDFPDDEGWYQQHQHANNKCAEVYCNDLPWNYHYFGFIDIIHFLWQFDDTVFFLQKNKQESKDIAQCDSYTGNECTMV